MSKDKATCSFCGRQIDREKIKNEEDYIFIGSNESILICGECVKECNAILAEEEGKKLGTTSNIKSGITPKSIKANLDEWIIGQNEAKKALSIALYNHYKRLNQPKDKNDLAIEKSNIILVGSTGSGKTASVSALAKSMDLPFVIEDVTSISSTGYVGRDTEDILKNLISAANGDIEKAQTGIVLLDEGDKLKREKNSSGARDVKGEGVQQGLLKMVEGGVFDVKMKGGVKKFDTTNVLFILGGAFEGIEKLIAKRLNKKDKTTKVGFTAKMDNQKKDIQKYNELIVQVKHEDLKEFGMMPELLGRFPVLTALEELSEEALVSILTQPKNAIIKQYKKMFNEDNVELEFSNEALIAIAKEARERKIGARALRSIVEEVLKEPMFEVPGSKISKVTIDKNLKVVYSEEKQLSFDDIDLDFSLTNKE